MWYLVLEVFMNKVLISKMPRDLSTQEARALLMAFQDRMIKHPNAVMGGTPECDSANGLCPLKHSFGDGCYIREIFMPKGTLIVSKIHKIKHPYFVLKGKVSVLTEKGVIQIKAPYSGMTPAGTKRLLYMHEDTVWVTVHVTKKTDIAEIEKDIIAKDFDELDKVKEMK